MGAVSGGGEGLIDLYRELAEKSIDIMVFFRPHGPLIHANPAALTAYGYTYEEILTKTFRDIRAPDTWDEIPAQLEQARAGSFRFETVHTRENGMQFPVEATWSFTDVDGDEIVLSVIRDITDKHEIAEALRQSESELKDFFDTAAIALHWVDSDGIIQRANQAELDMLGYSREEYLGKHIADFHHDQNTIDNILGCLTRGERIQEYPARLRRKDGHVRDVLITSSVLFKDGEFRHTRCFTVDVTDRLEAERDLRESEERFRLLVQHSANIIWRTGADGKYLGPQESFARFTGLDYEEYRQDGGLKAVHPEDIESVASGWQKALSEQRPFELEYRLRDHTGEYRHTLTRGIPMLDSSGSVREWVGYAEDITDRKRAESEKSRLLALEAEARLEAETLNELARTLAGELDLNTLVQQVTDATTTLTGAEFGAFFYNVLSEAGESFTLYTLSGAPRSAFEQFPMPRNTPIFNPTFTGQGVVRIEDVMSDPRYGTMSPYHGMPEGHLPVKSYLAAPVISRSGEVLGGLFFGHSSPGMFRESHERMIVGLAAHAAVAMDNARLYAEAQTEIRQRESAELELRAARDILEETVAERTAELRQVALDLQAEVDVRKDAERRLRHLMSRLVNIQEEERRRIRRNIHDQLGQQMTGIRINLASLEERAREHDTLAELAHKVQVLAEELDASIDFVTWELLPGELASIGLEAALRDLIETWSRRFAIPAGFIWRAPDGMRLAKDVEANLYRIVQEALHNVVKHAEASHADLLVEMSGGVLTLIVEDDGVGFDIDEHHGDGRTSLGLVSMRERASVIDAEFDLESAAGRGTTVFVRLPVAAVETRALDGTVIER
jgi:PAS domain S-box-containing protein